MTMLQGSALALYLIVMLIILRSLSIQALLANKLRQHLIFGAGVALFVLWFLRVAVNDGLNIHFLGIVALTLVMGFRYAIIVATLALIGLCAIGQEPWALFGVNALLGVVIPIAVTYLIFTLAFHHLPRQFFVYIFVCAFFPAAIVVALKMGLMGGYYWFEGIHSWDDISNNYLLMIPLMLFPEGLLNGMTMTLLVIYKPYWVYTFHDKFYIDNN